VTQIQIFPLVLDLFIDTMRVFLKLLESIKYWEYIDLFINAFLNEIQDDIFVLLFVNYPVICKNLLQ